jgi:hypothetical protein
MLNPIINVNTGLRVGPVGVVGVVSVVVESVVVVDSVVVEVVSLFLLDSGT